MMARRATLLSKERVRLASWSGCTVMPFVLDHSAYGVNCLFVVGFFWRSHTEFS
jgi:hypothetical protein